MNLLELHLLQSFPVTCLNRDDAGSPKTVYFGGVQRARVSSQCWKRAVRARATELAPEYFQGRRGKYHSLALAEKLRERGVAEETATQYAEAAMDALTKNDAKDSARTSVALYLSPAELDAVAQALADALSQNVGTLSETKNAGKGKADKGGKVDQKLVVKAIKGATKKGFVDVAVFGRMVAADYSLTLEGAAMFAHAISTHASSNEIDFFSAVDDTKADADDAGAGHIGTLEMNSACYYRYVGLNLDLLFDAEHLGAFSAGERVAALKTFLQATLESVPSARHNSMFGATLPQYALGVVRNGQPLSLANAFETPVKARGGFVQPSIVALEEHWNQMKTTYSLEKTVKSENIISQEFPMDAWLDRVVGSALGENV